MSASETIRQRLMAEAASRPISVALMDTLTSFARSDIIGAIQSLVADNLLRDVRGRPGTYELAATAPDAKSLLTLLANRPRPLAELQAAVAWAPVVVREAVRQLQEDGLVHREGGPDDALMCTAAGFRLCGWPEPFQRTQTRPSRDVALELLRKAPRPLNLLGIGLETGWPAAKAQEVMDDLVERDLVEYDAALGLYAIPLQAYPGAPAHPNGGPPPPPPPAPPVATVPNRRDRLAETFVPIVLPWLKHSDPCAPTFAEVARRCYALADAFLAEGSKGK